jgi:predicted amidohydrolase YtcJ
LAHCARHGITSMVNMDGNRYLLALLDTLRREGRLTARVKVPFHMKPHMEMAELARAEEMRHEFRSDWLSSNMVKMFMDGVVDSRTSFMLHDYPGHPGHRSVPLFEADHFAEICQDVDRRGMQIAVHATGDGAVRAVIDGYEATRKANGPRDSRHRIEHIEEIDPSDVPRLAELGIVASLQPGHAPGLGSFPLDPYVEIVGEAMLKNAFLCRSLAEAGAKIAFASDWPVIGVRVLDGIRDALTRTAYPGARNECLSLPDVLRAYTASGAWTAHVEALTGVLKPGLAGDVVVLTGDIEAVEPQAIPTLDVAATIAGGRVTFGA